MPTTDPAVPAALVPPLGLRLRHLALPGLAIGLLRYGCEFVAPAQAMWFGVYYVMPVLLLVIGLRRQWGPIGWRTLVSTLAIMCLIVWGLPNTLAYTTAQFAGWQHGRFYYGGPDDPANRAAPIAAGVLGKVGFGVMQGVLTSMAGFAWCTVFGTLFVWLPARRLAPHNRPPASGALTARS